MKVFVVLVSLSLMLLINAKDIPMDHHDHDHDQVVINADKQGAHVHTSDDKVVTESVVPEQNVAGHHQHDHDQVVANADKQGAHVHTSDDKVVMESVGPGQNVAEHHQHDHDQVVVNADKEGAHVHTSDDKVVTEAVVPGQNVAEYHQHDHDQVVVNADKQGAHVHTSDDKVVTESVVPGQNVAEHHQHDHDQVVVNADKQGAHVHTSDDKVVMESVGPGQNVAEHHQHVAQHIDPDHVKTTDVLMEHSKVSAQIPSNVLQIVTQVSQHVPVADVVGQHDDVAKQRAVRSVWRYVSQQVVEKPRKCKQGAHFHTSDDKVVTESVVPEQNVAEHHQHDHDQVVVNADKEGAHVHTSDDKVVTESVVPGQNVAEHHQHDHDQVVVNADKQGAHVHTSDDKVVTESVVPEENVAVHQQHVAQHIDPDHVKPTDVLMEHPKVSVQIPSNVQQIVTQVSQHVPVADVVGQHDDVAKQRTVRSVWRYVSQQVVEKPRKCDFQCSELDLPICAANGRCHRQFKSLCEMNAFNCLQSRKIFHQVHDFMCQDQDSVKCYPGDE